MKKTFRGHFPQSKRDIKKLWDSCLFVFDANILLNLYRYSDKTRDEFLQVLSSVKDRIWIPHRAAEEFFANRLTVIGQQEKAYDETIRTIEALQADLENARQHPFVSDRTMHQVRQVFERLKQELTNNQKIHTKRISDDSIQDAIAKVFAGRVGKPYEREQLDAIFEDGKARYADSIPPGYKDQGKSEGTGAHSEKCRVYGDLLVWYQILDQAGSSDTSIILVTDDKKEDWWQTFKGKTLGPRPELVQEFLTRTDCSFHMYQADRFLEFANQYLEQKITETALSEIREVRRRDVEAQNEARRRREREVARRIEYESLGNEAHALSERLTSLADKREKLLLQRRILQDAISEDTSDAERAEKLMAILPQTREIESQMAATEAELAAVENSRRHIRRDMSAMRVSRRFIESRHATDG